MKISKHKTTHILCCALCAAAAIFSSSLMSSCADGIDAPDQGQKEGYITLSLSNSRLSSSRAEDATNEFLINKALVCFFVGDAPTDDALPAYANVFTINLYDQADIKITLTDELLNTLFPGESTEATAYVIANLDGNVPASGKNPDVTQALGMTLSELKSLAIESDFASMEHQASFVMDGQSVLALDSDPQKNPAHSSVSGTVNLQRAAAKIMLSIKLIDTVTDGAGETWKSMPADMKVIISNGVKKSNVTPNPAAVADGDRYSTVMVNPDNDSYSARGFTKNEAEGSEYPYELDSPFYTYPTQWDANPTSLGEDMTYLQLMVPWEMQKKNADTEEWESAGIYRTCYYAIPVLQTENVIVRNVAYQININVNILGTFRPDQPEILDDASYRAVGWGEAPVDVEIQDYRYLVLDQTEYTVNNAASIDIPFYSSHETIVIQQNMWYSLYNTAASGLVKKIQITEAQNKASTHNGEHIYSASVNNNLNAQTATRTLNFTHELVQWTPLNSRGQTITLGPNGTTYPDAATINQRIAQIVSYSHTNDAAYSTYIDTIYIAHKDKVTFNPDGITVAVDDEGKPISDPKFTKMVIITQYPAMYIETTQNFYPSNVTINGTNCSAIRGNLYVNGNNTNNTLSNWYATRGLDGSNKNPNQYVIAITTLSDGSNYIIDDPRVKVINNLTDGFEGNAPNTGWASATPIDGGTNRQLVNYYPTDGTGTSMYKIAPKIRIASSYGVCGNSIGYQAAQRRCASYQELQYPAGRWRIPTVGELEYIIQLSQTQKIPILFNSGSTYWTAQGKVTTTLVNGNLSVNNINTTGTAYVRCVYDEWYWENTDYPTIQTTATQTFTINGQTYTLPQYPFTWGDMPISQSN